MEAIVPTEIRPAARVSKPEPAKPQRQRRWWPIVGLLLIGAVALGMYMGWIPIPGRAAVKQGETAAPKATARTEQVIAVTVAPVTPRAIQRRVPMVGTLHGFDEVTITPKVEGQVTDLFHDVGDVVKPGEPLLQVDKINYENGVSEAEKALGLELAKLGIDLVETRLKDADAQKLPMLARAVLEKFDVRKLPSIVRALNAEQNAEGQWQRVQQAKLGTSAEERDRIFTDFQIARANHQQAVLEANATVATVRHRIAALDSALQRLTDTTVVAPIPNDAALQNRDATNSTGKAPSQSQLYVVAKRLVSVGTMVRSFPSVPVFELVRDFELKMMGNLPERYVGEVRQPTKEQPSQRVEVTLEAYPGQVFEGRIAMVSPVVDLTNRTFQVEVRIPNPKRQLKAGSFAKATILTREQADVPTVPEEALVSFAGVTKVFVVKDGKAQGVEVKPGVRLTITTDGRKRNWVEVQGDIPPGSQVVTSGQTQLADGTPVRLR